MKSMNDAPHTDEIDHPSLIIQPNRKRYWQLQKRWMLWLALFSVGFYSGFEIVDLGRDRFTFAGYILLNLNGLFADLITTPFLALIVAAVARWTPISIFPTTLRVGGWRALGIGLAIGLLQFHGVQQ